MYEIPRAYKLYYASVVLYTLSLLVATGRNSASWTLSHIGDASIDLE